MSHDVLLEALRQRWRAQPRNRLRCQRRRRESRLRHQGRGRRRRVPPRLRHINRPRGDTRNRRVPATGVARTQGGRERRGLTSWGSPSSHFTSTPYACLTRWTTGKRANSSRPSRRTGCGKLKDANKMPVQDLTASWKTL